MSTVSTESLIIVVLHYVYYPPPLPSLPLPLPSPSLSLMTLQQSPMPLDLSPPLCTDSIMNLSFYSKTRYPQSLWVESKRFSDIMLAVSLYFIPPIPICIPTYIHTYTHTCINTHDCTYIHAYIHHILPASPPMRPRLLTTPLSSAGSGRWIP